MSDDLRVAVSRLTPRERQSFAAKCQDASIKHASSRPELGQVWHALADVVLDVDRNERARVAALVQAEQHTTQTMRPARRGRK